MLDDVGIVPYNVLNWLNYKFASQTLNYSLFNIHYSLTYPDKPQFISTIVIYYILLCFFILM